MDVVEQLLHVLWEKIAVLSADIKQAQGLIASDEDLDAVTGMIEERDKLQGHYEWLKDIYSPDSLN